MRYWLIWGCLVAMVAGCTGNVVDPTRTPVPIRNVTIEAATLEPISVPTIDLTQPTLAATNVATRCPSAPSVRLIVMERGRVTRNEESLNLRDGPGIDYEILTILRASAIFMVVDGPACSGDFTWFKVQIRGRTGWIAEGDLEQYYVEPYLTG